MTDRLYEAGAQPTAVSSVSSQAVPLLIFVGASFYMGAAATQIINLRGYVEVCALLTFTNSYGLSEGLLPLFPRVWQMLHEHVCNCPRFGHMSGPRPERLTECISWILENIMALVTACHSLTQPVTVGHSLSQPVTVCHSLSGLVVLVSLCNTSPYYPFSPERI
jgi:hypothetical protein